MGIAGEPAAKGILLGTTGRLIEVYDFYAALVESNDDAIVAKDTEGVVVAWNPAAERLFGYSAAEMVGQSIRRLLPPDRQDEEDEILARIRAGERITQLFTKRVHKDGHVFDVAVTISPVRDRNGTIVGASKIARDARPILEGQRRLRESEERFRMLAENISQFAWIARPDGEIAWFNRRWYEFTGATPEGSLGSDWWAFHDPAHLQRTREHFRRSIERGEDWEDTFPLRGHDGRYRWFLSRAQPIRDEDGAIVWWFGTNTDVTEQREQAEQIQLLLMEVNHRSKNLLSTVQALARRSVVENPAFIARFEERLRSLAANQDILVRRAWREVPIRELIEAQLTFLPGKLAAVTIEGEDCALKPRAGEVIGMALHELATNSLKYGALSAESGRVAIRWECPPDRQGFAISWIESGGPPVVEPERAGFGTTLIRDVPRHNLAAQVELDYRPEGLRWSLVSNADAIVHAAGDS